VKTLIAVFINIFRVVSSLYDNTVKAWDVETGKMLVCILLNASCRRYSCKIQIYCFVIDKKTKHSLLAQYSIDRVGRQAWFLVLVLVLVIAWSCVSLLMNMSWLFQIQIGMIIITTCLSRCI